MAATRLNGLRRMFCAVVAVCGLLLAFGATAFADNDPPNGCKEPGNHYGLDCGSDSASPPPPSASDPAPPPAPSGEGSYGGLYPGSGGVTPGTTVFPRRTR